VPFGKGPWADAIFARFCANLSISGFINSIDCCFWKGLFFGRRLGGLSFGKCKDSSNSHILRRLQSFQNYHSKHRVVLPQPMKGLEVHFSLLNVVDEADWRAGELIPIT